MVNPSSDSTAVASPASQVELADVVRRFGPAYATQYGAAMMPSQRKALADIAACCTKELGGRLYHCDNCQESFWQDHCCRNRACPKCHGTQTREWLQQREAELLPCPYFHAVATIPSQLQAAFYKDQKFMYGLLMRVAAQAVRELCAVKRHLGALPGILAVLHTWTGELAYHPHVHLLITGGGVTPDGQSWQPARGQFLVPVRLLSRKIAALFREALRKEKPDVFATLPECVWHLEWVSFCKYYGHGNDAVLNYLSRYVFRTAISNARILAMDETHVTFRYKDRSNDTWRTVRLPGVEFLRRFLQHVLPRGFHRVRYYGLWHPSQRDVSSRISLLLQLENAASVSGSGTIADVLAALGDSMTNDGESSDEAHHAHESPCRCPSCGSTRTRLLAEYPRLGVP
ncbi:MAG: transposase [Pirellulaceae bacterium]